MSQARETFRPDGSLASVVEDRRLIMYDREGNVTHIEEFDSYNRPVVTYRNGVIAAIERPINSLGERRVTLFDDNSRVTTSVDLGKDDIVNFADGYLASIIRYSGFNGRREMTEVQYNTNGRILSETHRVSTGRSYGEDNMFITTSHTTYHENGRIASVVSYRQRHHREDRRDYRSGEDRHDEKVDSYAYSIEQYDENGRSIISLRPGENDDISFNNGMVSSHTRRDDEGRAISTTTYNPNGTVANVTHYNGEGLVLVSITYNNDGVPVSSTQIGEQAYQDVFRSTSSLSENPPTKKRSSNDSKKVDNGLLQKMKKQGFSRR